MVYKHIGDGSDEWSGKTYTEIQSIAEQDGSILIVPVGSIEQHGHHLPVVTDTVLVDAVAQLGAEQGGETLPVVVTPPVWQGYSPHHLPFGGTLTLEHDTFLRILRDIGNSGLENGFDALLLLNGHGGNSSLIDTAVKMIGRAHPSNEVLGLTYFELARSFIDDIRDSDRGGMSHGGEFETSLMLHLRPDLVTADEMDGTPREGHYSHEGDDLMQGGPLSVYRSFDAYSSSGAIGSPELASAEKGQLILDRLGDAIEVLLTEIHKETR